jgi:hypothetical protein
MFSYVLLLSIGFAVAYWLPNDSRPAVSYSPDFKKQAQQTVDAIERYQRYWTTFAEFEAQKELDRLSQMDDTLGETNAVLILSEYFFRTRQYHIQPNQENLDQYGKAFKTLIEIQYDFRFN